MVLEYVQELSEGYSQILCRFVPCNITGILMQKLYYMYVELQ